MKKELVPSSDWSEMSDREKIESVLTAAVQPAFKDRPSYQYLVSFIGDMGQAYDEEVQLRKALAKSALTMALILFVLMVPAMFGLIEMAKQLGLRP